MNIAHHLGRGQLLFPDKIALIFEDKSFTYKQSDQLANPMENGLRGLEIQKGNCVALLLPMIIEFIISYFCIQLLALLQNKSPQTYFWTGRMSH